MLFTLEEICTIQRILPKELENSERLLKHARDTQNSGGIVFMQEEMKELNRLKNKLDGFYDTAILERAKALVNKA